VLPGPRVQRGDGEIATSPSLELESILNEFVSQPDDVRAAFLSVFAHSLTVEIRVALHDRPVSNEDAASASLMNEWLHQLTSCLNPKERRGPRSEADLIRDIALEALRHRLQRAMGRAVAAAKNVIAKTHASVAAIDG
jgi:hypothetical protein